MNALYLCYQSLLEPLTQTQVVPYLEGLAQAGHHIVLLTFEPRRITVAETREHHRHLAAKGITWYRCPYHKQPTLLATAWDVAIGTCQGLLLIRRYKVRLVHARVHVAGVIALLLKRLTKARFLFDVRGLMAEEYADAGVWPPGGTLFRLTKRAERTLIAAADAVVVLTHEAKDLLLQSYPQETAGKPLAVIPCCVDFRHHARLKTANPPPLPEDGKTMVYIGKLDGWYPTDAIAGLMAAAIRMIPGLRWQVWTQSDPARLHSLLADRGINAQVAVGSIAPEALPAVLARAHAALSFRNTGPSALGASPTKIGEYLAAGLPVIANSGVGDTEALLRGRHNHSSPKVGVIVRDFTDKAYREALDQLIGLLDDPATPLRCRAAARRHLDLEHVGWARYRQVYNALIDSTKGN